MKAKLIVEGKEFPIEIQDPELQKLLTPQKKTGYEREKPSYYYYVDADGLVEEEFDDCDSFSDNIYNTSNYYSSENVAQNNARADKLMRQLRRFAVEHREKEINWNKESYKYMIRYVHSTHDFVVGTEISGRDFGEIAFDSKDTCNLAIETFRDELIWYFTEYKDSL